MQRPVRELTPIPLMHLASGFWSFKTFAVSLELGLYDLTADGRVLDARQVAEHLAVERRPADILLAACASLGLLHRQEHGYTNSPLADEFLVTGRPYYFGGLVRYLDRREYPAWDKVLEAIRTNRPVTWDPGGPESLFSAEDPVMMALFWEATHSLSGFTARVLGQAYDFTRHRRLLDVGGGSGAFPLELCRRYPELEATVYELPHVCDLADQKIEMAGMTGRIATVKGDFLADPALPGGHDVVLLSMIMHDWDEATDRAILRKCRQALTADGTLLICELLLDPARSGPPDAALMGMNVLVETAGGQNYSEDEYLAWLKGEGFAEAEVIRFASPGANGVVIARRTAPIPPAT